MAGSERFGALERLGTTIDEIRMWFSKAWKIGRLMAKGAYLVTERRRLFVKLGEEVYYRILRGEMHNVELEPLVHQLDRLTKKVEIEEMLIRSLRFGTKAAKGGRSTRSEVSNSTEGGM